MERLGDIVGVQTGFCKNWDWNDVYSLAKMNCKNKEARQVFMI